MNVYVDFDGVLVTKDVIQAPYAFEFVTYLTENHTVYWLTSHCQGEVEPVLQYVRRYVDSNVFEVLKKFKPTRPLTSKAKIIDYSVPFLWFDDYLFKYDIEVLEKHGVLKNWIKIDLSKNPNQLHDCVTSMKHNNQ